MSEQLQRESIANDIAISSVILREIDKKLLAQNMINILEIFFLVLFMILNVFYR